jgi:hypothetical protein
MINKELDQMFDKLLTKVSKDFVQEKKRTRRGRGLSRRAIRRLYSRRVSEVTIKDAAYQVMEQAYMRASANGTLPANARQIMYQARPLIQKLTDKMWKNDSLFTQKLLPDYMREYAAKTAGWDVVYDARGHMQEPHTELRVDLGTLDVRRYVKNWHTKIPDLTINPLGLGVETQGPANRYKFGLFIEKEGFNTLLERAEIAAKYDIAIMSTKGMSVTASRDLVARWSRQGVITLVAHDCDYWGFNICHTLQTDTRRYQFTTTPLVRCLGLRLKDAQSMGLDTESVDYKNHLALERTMLKAGATPAEAAFLCGDGLEGSRIELNAMDSQQFIDWLEEKLAEAGVTKVVPDKETLEAAYRRAVKIARANRMLAELEEEWNTNGHSEIEIPNDLAEKIRALIKDTNRSWDSAILDVACQPPADPEKKPKSQKKQKKQEPPQPAEETTADSEGHDIPDVLRIMDQLFQSEDETDA